MRQTKLTGTYDNKKKLQTMFNPMSLLVAQEIEFLGPSTHTLYLDVSFNCSADCNNGIAKARMQMIIIRLELTLWYVSRPHPVYVHESSET